MEDIATPVYPLPPDDYPQLCLMFTNSIKTTKSSEKVGVCVRVCVCVCVCCVLPLKCKITYTVNPLINALQ